MTSAERTKQSYDRHPYPAADIGQLVQANDSLPPQKWMQAIGRPGRAAPTRILVAGCGTGVEALVLRRRLPKAEIVAVDFSARSIAVARRLQRQTSAARPVVFQVADLLDPDLPHKTGGRFDLITCHGVLSYIPEPGRMLMNLGACLDSGGALYLGVNGEAHPAARLRPWLAGFGLAVDALLDERRLRELLGLWDALNDDGGGELATMSASYLGGDVCGPHFNNWSVARWRAEVNRSGWEIAGTDVMPLALQLAAERDNHDVLFPIGIGELAARLDQARPAGFHRMMLRRAKAGSLDAVGARKGLSRHLTWTGFYSVRFSKGKRGADEEAAFVCPTLRQRCVADLTGPQARALRKLVESGVASSEWIGVWNRAEAARRLIWLWTGLGIIAVGDGAAGVR